MTKPSTKNNFDILRLILAVLVFFAHWNILTQQNLSNPLFHLSGYAVSIFFIVSGFLIFWSFDNDQNKKHFYTKRFFRIFPLYMALILFQTLFFVIVTDGNFGALVKYFVSNILFLNFLAPSVGNTLSHLQVDAINGSLWTLKNEVIFYALVPLIFALYKKWGIYFLVLLYCLSVAFMFTVNDIGSSKLLSQFPAQLRLFVTGIILYVLFHKFNSLKILVTLPFAFSLLFFLNDNVYFGFAFSPMLLGLIVLTLTSYLRYVHINFDFSYSFYILHFPIIQLSLYFGINPDNPWMSFISLFSIIFIMSYFSERYIEKQFIRIGKNIIRKNKDD